MPVRVEVKINGETISTVNIRNVTPGAEQPHAYRVEVWNEGSFMDPFVIEHRQGDGALTLVNKALTKALHRVEDQ